MRRLTSRTWALLMGILVLNVALQARTFFIAHVTGDQRLYVGLAMKLVDQGWPGYNLRQINVRPQDGFVEFYPARPEDRQGDLLRMLVADGTTFYDQPLYHTPPLFAALVALSHATCAPRDGVVVLGRAGEQATPFGQRFARQFYGCIVPVASSVVLVLATFVLGCRVGDEETGLVAALLLALSPVQILAGQRLWADSTLAALVTLSLLCWLAAAADNRRFYWAVAAVCFGLALMTKIAALFTVPAFFGGAWLYRQRKVSLALFWGVVLVITLPWYVTVWRTFGTPLYAPQQPGISQSHPWFALINRQPWWTYLAAIPYQVPVFAIGMWGSGWALVRGRKAKAETVLALTFLVWLVGLTVTTSLDEMVGPEQRYLLPVYPMLAILTAQGIHAARSCVRERINARVAGWLLTAAVAGSVAWSLWVMWRSRRYDEIVLPF